VTDFTDPRFHAYEADGVELEINPIRLFSNYTINNKHEWLSRPEWRCDILTWGGHLLRIWTGWNLNNGS
jgi:hypothetical protein